MPENNIITSARNPRVVNARKLTQRKHRSRQGRFLGEGQQLLWMALDAGFHIEETFYSDKLDCAQSSTRELLDRLSQHGSTLTQVTPDILASLSTRSEGDTLVGVIAQCTLTLDDIILPESPLVLVLDRLQDCGNVGTLIRTADAAGATAVVLLEPSADMYDPRAVRSSMGSLFNLPVVSLREIDTLTVWLRANGLRLIAADAHQGTLWGHALMEGGVALMEGGVALMEGGVALMAGGVALCLGNEARGLSSDVSASVDAWVRLPMRGKADSLNVAVAGGILMYLWVKNNA